MNHREGSRVGKVYAAYRDGGADAAIKLGKELGLADITVKDYIRIWYKGQGPQPTRKSDVTEAEQRALDRNKGWFPKIARDKLVLKDGRRCYVDGLGVITPYPDTEDA